MNASTYHTVSHARRAVAWTVFVLCVAIAVFGVSDYTFAEHAAVWQYVGLANVAYIGVGGAIGAYLAFAVLRYETRAQRQSTEWVDEHQTHFL